jgi:hypothetical protein
MKIWTIDGKRIVEINAIGSRLKEACAAESKGQMTKAGIMLERALKAERDLK